MTAYATTGQAALIRKMIASHVVSPEEREGFQRRLRDGFTKGTPSDAIEWLKTEIAQRKKAEKDAAAAEQTDFTAEATMSAAESYLKKFPPPETRPALHTVYGSEADGSRWSIATDGHVMVCERTENALPEMTDGKWDGRSVVAQCLAQDGADMGEIDLADLRKFCGDPIGPCIDCDGTGELDHSCNCEYCDVPREGKCEECDGTGIAPMEGNYGWVGECAIDLPVLARALDVMPASGNVRLRRFHRSDRSHGLYLDTGTIRAIVMGVVASYVPEAAPRMLVEAAA